MDIIATDIESAQPIVDKINLLTKERTHVLKQWNGVAGVNNKRHQQLQCRLAEIKSEIIALKEGIEYVRLKMFIYVSKRYLTKPIYKQIWDEVDKELEIKS